MITTRGRFQLTVGHQSVRTPISQKLRETFLTITQKNVPIFDGQPFPVLYNQFSLKLGAHYLQCWLSSQTRFFDKFVIKSVLQHFSRIIRNPWSYRCILCYCIGFKESWHRKLQKAGQFKKNVRLFANRFQGEVEAHYLGFQKSLIIWGMILKWSAYTMWNTTCVPVQCIYCWCLFWKGSGDSDLEKSN